MPRFAICILFLISWTAYAQQKHAVVFLHETNVSGKARKSAHKILDAKIDSLRAAGKMIAAGAFEHRGRIIIVNDLSVENIRDWLDSDPASPDPWSFEVAPLQMRWGSLCPVAGDGDIVEYTFIRFDAITAKYTAGTFPQVIRQHDLYLKRLIETGNVVAEATFADNDGGILIMKGDVQREIFENDPGVTEGLMDFSVRKLLIARGSFCEN